MTELLVFTWGICIGLFYYGGLYWTVCRMVGSKRAVFFSISSFFFRLAVFLAAVYVIFDGRINRLFWILAGFFSARILMIKMVSKTGKSAPDNPP
ncbi:MAG: ATP synthase subunit I [Desulfobacterales bacterium]